MIEETEHLEPEQFDLLVSDVMDTLPEDWTPIFERVTVVVEDEPGEDDLPVDADPDVLPLGRFRGGSGSVRFLGGLTGPAPVAPPEIALFQGPLERASATEDELRSNVRVTLVRELGHVFGLDVDELLGADDELGDADEAAE